MIAMMVVDAGNEMIILEVLDTAGARHLLIIVAAEAEGDTPDHAVILPVVINFGGRQCFWMLRCKTL